MGLPMILMIDVYQLHGSMYVFNSDMDQFLDDTLDSLAICVMLFAEHTLSYDNSPVIYTSWLTD